MFPTDHPSSLQFKARLLSKTLTPAQADLDPAQSRLVFQNLDLQFFSSHTITNTVGCKLHPWEPSGFVEYFNNLD